MQRMNSVCLSDSFGKSTLRKRRIFCSYLSYLSVCEFCVVMIIALSVAPSSFVHAISNIFLGSSNEQVSGVDALRVVAPMAHLHALRNSANALLENEPVSAVSNATLLDLCIPGIIQAESPLPATGLGLLVDVRPESFPEGSIHLGSSRLGSLNTNLFASHEDTLLTDSCKVNTI